LKFGSSGRRGRNVGLTITNQKGDAQGRNGTSLKMKHGGCVKKGKKGRPRMGGVIIQGAKSRANPHAFIDPEETPAAQSATKALAVSRRRKREGSQARGSHGG